jgi:hypothetical protein
LLRPFSRIEIEMQRSVLLRRSGLVSKETLWMRQCGPRASRRAKWLVIESLMASCFLICVLCWYRVMLVHEFALKRSLKPAA